MSEKTPGAGAPDSMKKNSAMVLAAVCLLAGVFIGFNVSLFLDAGSGGEKTKPVVSVANPQASQPAFDFDALIKAAEAEPTRAQGWVSLGHAYFDTDKYAEAVAAYEKALAIDSGDADVWVDMGVMYRRLGNPLKAVDCFNQASVVDPRHETARFNKGIVQLHDLNDRAGAIATWQTLLKMNPEHVTPSGKHLHTLVDEVKSGL